MIAMMNDTSLEFIRAIRRRWPNPDERAAAMGITRRQLRRWELGEDVPQIITRLIDLGVVAIVDIPGQNEGEQALLS